MTYQHLYEQLGNLFYSVAAADDKIRETEVDALKKIISDKWLNVEDSTDEFGTDAAHYIFITFDYNVAEIENAENRFNNFKAFYNEHKEMFSHKIKQLTTETAEAITKSFAGTNKEEYKQLDELFELFAN